MKNITLIIMALISITTSANVECLKFMVNVKNAKVLMQKRCKLIIRDASEKEVFKADTCFTKLENQFDKISYALTGDFIYKDGKKESTIVNTTNAIETDQDIKINILSASPELFTQYKENIVFDKHNMI